MIWSRYIDKLQCVQRLYFHLSYHTHTHAHTLPLSLSHTHKHTSTSEHRNAGHVTRPSVHTAFTRPTMPCDGQSVSWTITWALCVCVLCVCLVSQCSIEVLLLLNVLIIIKSTCSLLKRYAPVHTCLMSPECVCECVSEVSDQNTPQIFTHSHTLTHYSVRGSCSSEISHRVAVIS